MGVDQLLDACDLLFVRERFQMDQLLIAQAFIEVEHISDAAGHTGCEVFARLAEDDDLAAGHVFAAVVADAFDDDGRTAVSDAEAFPCLAGDEGFPACRAEEGDVSDDDIVFRAEGGFSRRDK